jgi:hypothetical protein
MPFCGRCGAEIDPRNIDRERDLATCGHCQNLIDLRALGEVPRAFGPLPKRIHVVEGSGRLVITRDWWRTKHVVLIAAVGVAVIWLVMQWIDALGESRLPETYVLILTPFILAWDFMLLIVFVTKTRIVVRDGRVDVRTTPFALAKNATFAASDLSQLFAVKEGPYHAVMAELRSGQVVPLLRLIALPAHALVIEQRIEHALKIADRSVEGELKGTGATGHRYANASGAVPLGQAPSQQAGPVPQAASDGKATAIAILLLPLLLVAGLITLVVHAFTAGVEGSITAKGALGDFTFQPDDCASGQTMGFFGVELTSEHDTKRRIRLMNDELGQPKIAVLVDDQKPKVLAANQCPGMKLAIVRTNDVTNGVYLVEGAVAADCPLFRANVTYERCGL